MNITTEKTFETALVQSLVEQGGYTQGNATDFSHGLGMFKYEVVDFLQRTQPQRWEKLVAIHGEEDIHNRIIQRLHKELDLRGCLDVLRNGFVDYGVRFQMAFFQPASGMNSKSIELFNQNSLKVYRQVYYSSKNQNSVDVVLSLNGIPIVTLELKNQFTGQNVTNTLRQYSATRDSRELLFAFNKRALVHFAVDQDEVFMTTKLDGRLDQFHVYRDSEIDEFAQIYFDPIANLNNPKEQKILYSLTDIAVDRFNTLDDEKRDEFKKGLGSWTNLYAFLAQIMPFVDVDFEKFYAYSKRLLIRLPKRDLTESLHLDDEVALEYYRLQKIKEGAIVLAKSEKGEIGGTSEAGLKRAKDEEVLLSEIITILNDRFGTEFEEADKLFFDQIEAELLEDEILQTQARVNKLDTFKFAFDDKFIDKLISRMDQNQEIFEKILEDKSFGDLVREMMMKRIFWKLNE